MKTQKRNIIITFSILISFAFLFIIFAESFNQQNDILSGKNKNQRIRSSSSPKAGIKTKEARWDYFYKMLRDPRTKQIPVGIRQKELNFARQLTEQNRLNKRFSINELDWKEAGPRDVGGRTRALAIDVANPNTIIAGGVSGGMWKSTNKGASWLMKSTSSQVLSVTSIAQDTRAGHTNTWYYATGEFSGSAQDLGFTHRISGDGIYKSTDNGETWNLLQNTKDSNPIAFNTPYDFVTKIIVNPQTGSVFIASNAFGILKSAAGGAAFNISLGNANEHIYSDIVVAANGTLVAVVSSPFQGITPSNTPGVYKSTNDGQTWTNITPASFPTYHLRSVVAIAPSNNDVAYVLTHTGEEVENANDDIRFFKINIASGNNEDRSANMPVFPFFDDYESIDTQGGYNMTLAVKPDDENFVVIGATNLFRSTNGFATQPANQKNDWIGGYHPDQFDYPNFHADVHSFAFDPNNHNSVWWGHDGGLSYAEDIRTTNYDEFFPWVNKNNGYNVTQFYMIAIADEAGDNRIMGGTQDNGTPAFRFDGTTISGSYDVSSGDGAYCYFGDDFPYVSAQNGAIIRGNYDNNGNPQREYPNWSNITPNNAEDMLFINPFVIDPSDENIMIYPAGNKIWRNNQLNSLPNNPDFGTGTSQGWTQLTNLSAPQGYTITSMAMSVIEPSHRLYYAAIDYSQNATGLPKIYKLDNANTATGAPVDISIAGLPPANYPHNIAVNPDNGNEIMVIFSNYNIVGIYHSTNGGQNFTSVEGNLTGTEQNPGPSIRGATILPTESGAQYFVATSTGVYSTDQLNGANTIWTLEGENTIGNVVVNYLASRKSDGTIVAGTHGRGAFIAKVDAGTHGVAVPSVNVNNLNLQFEQGQTGTTSFILSNTGTAPLTYNISASGNFSGNLSKTNNPKYVLQKTESGISTSSILKTKLQKAASNKRKLIKQEAQSKFLQLNKVNGDDILYLDDGDSGADMFIGFGGDDFDWMNEFTVSGFNYTLDGFGFYMRTEDAYLNEIYAAVFDEDFNLLSDGDMSLALAPTGDWFDIDLNPSLTFADGETFYIEIYSYSSIPYPAGADEDASVPNKSYYFNGYEWANLNTQSGYETTAFLIRAYGTKTTETGNQSPVAIANISETSVDINESITFDASSSYDNDGQITNYLWNFGDGLTSTEQIATHSYSQANVYNYTLLVTDDDGATNQVSGQVTVNGASGNYVTVNPSSGTITPGGSQVITITLNAAGLQGNSFTGNVLITTNNGNIDIPINYLIVDVEDISQLPVEFGLSQNYPNPFNPTTVIEFTLPKSSFVSMKVFDQLGREVANVVNEVKSTGKHKVNFDASALPSGVYIYRVKAGDYFSAKKMLLIK